MRGIVVIVMLVVLGGAAGAKLPVAEADAFAENACVQCHRDLSGRSSEIVHFEWGLSIHFQAKVGCDGCHGGNAALRQDQFGSAEAWKKASHLERNHDFLVLPQESPFVSAARGRSISYLCGKCHAAIKEQHLGSPHGEFGEPTCLYCHGQGTHMIVHPSPGIIDTRSRAQEGRCSRCHKAATMEAVTRIGTLLTKTEAQIQTSGKQYAQLEEWGYRNLELEKLHHHASEVRSRLRQTFHSFNMRDINNFAGEIQASVDRTTATYEMVERLRQTQRRQTLVGISAVALLLTFAGLLLFYKHAFLGHGASPERAESTVSADEQAVH